MWSIEHVLTIFPTFLVMIAFSFMLGKLLKGKSEFVRSIPLQLIAMTLVMMEIIKQVRAVGENGYDLYALPLHFCSLFLYILPLHSFFRVKPRPIIDALTIMLTASLIVNMFVMPANIYGEGNIREVFKSYGSFHTVVFHNLVCLYGMLMISLKTYKVHLVRDIIASNVFVVFYVIVATIASYTLKTNYHNLYRCNIDFIYNFVESLKASLGGFGWIVQAAYVGLLFIATIIMCLASYLLAYGIIKLISFFEKRNEKKLAETV